MSRRTKKWVWTGAALLLVLALATFFWRRRFHNYTPVEALQDLRAAAAVRNNAKPVEQFLEIRYGPLNEPANRQKAFLDFFNIGHIEGLYLIVGRIPVEHRQSRIEAMAQWIADYRRTMSPEEKQELGTYLRSEAGRATLQQATAQYLQKDVRFRAATASVIQELMATLAAVDKK
jgi:hypothetical protein